jgi:glycosyltransferase involved in cell wall biosynthesis
MRVAFVSWQPLADLDTGYKRRVHSLASHLVNMEVAVVSPPPRVQASFDHVTVRPSRAPRIPGLSRAPLFGYRLPAGRLRVRRALEEFGPDVVHSEGIWPFPSVHDFARRTGVPVVVTIHNVEHVVAKRCNRSPLVVRFLRRLEQATYDRADLLVCMSEVDRSVVQGMGVSGVEVVVVPNGATIPAEEPAGGAGQAIEAAGPVILFMGKLDYRPNVEALRFLLDEVYPLVRQTVPEAVLAVVGAPAPRGLPEGVVALGGVRSVWPYLAAADVCVAPLMSGSGTRLKILEYLAAGRPVVSTSIGIEGLDVAAGRDLLVADESSSFAAAIVRLLRSPADARSLGAAGRRLVEQRYRWDVIAREYGDRVRARFGSGR